MADKAGGRISEADRERVRDASRIEAVVGDYVALKRAGSGNLKGLCPFHDEKTPSFTVSTSRGFYHCFGCGEGGDVFDFLMKIDQLSFVEAVQQLAERAGITVTLSAAAQGSGERANRSKLTAITAAAADFYRQHLADEEAAAARNYLIERGFDGEAAAHFGCGFAPSGWDSLVKYLMRQGFSVPDMIAAGVARTGQRGPIDQFHRRLTWAIRDAAGDVVGFGARRIFDDDRIEAKYVNTSGDGRLYRKSQVLYGLDLAKREIVRRRQVVVVEGYTDVMAMHLAGVTTAVAACGTAFGEQHVEVLRRYLMDSELMHGEVIYVFDGDAAGQKAALKAFDSDQRFATNTFVAIAPGGMDPCEIRQTRGDAALRALVDSRIPLFRFAITHTLGEFDLETVEGRGAALAAAAPLVARIKDATARAGYIRELAERVGVDPREVDKRVRGARPDPRAQRREQHGAGGAARPGAAQRGGPQGSAVQHGAVQPGAAQGRADQAPPAARRPDSGPDRAAGQDGTATSDRRPAPPRPADPAAVVERETVKLALQYPALVAAGYDQLHPDCFGDPGYAAVHRAITELGGPARAAGPTWVTAVQQQLPAGPLHSLVTELAVEPLQYAAEPEPRYAGAILARMAERRAAAQERELVGALQRAEAAADRERAARLAGDLAQVSAYRRALADRARGGEG